VLAGPHPRSLRLDSLRSLAAAAAAGAADTAPAFSSPTVQHGQPADGNRQTTRDSL